MFTKHHSAVAIANCMLLLKINIPPIAGVMGSIPIPDSVGIAQLVEHSLLLRVRVPFSMYRDSSMAEHYTVDVAKSRSTPLLKMVKHLKLLLCAGLLSPVLSAGGKQPGKHQQAETLTCSRYHFYNKR